MENKIDPSPSSITNILTLRYDPTQKLLLSKCQPSDFQPTNTYPSIEFIEKTIVDSLKNRINVSDENISIALSGGVDSTLMLVLLKKTFPNSNIEAISIKFADSIDETENAALIAEKLDVNHNIVHLANYLSELPKAISIVKLPFWDLHWYHVVKKAATISKHLVAGDGGDEVFGGYTFRYEKFLSLVSQSSTSLEKVKAYLDCHERDRVPDQEKLFGRSADFSWDNIYNLLLPYFSNPLLPLDQVMLADFNGKLLYNFLPVNTRLDKFFNLKGVAPLLSNELISYMTHVPNTLKYDAKTNVGKLLLRKILSKYGVDDLVSKDKLGFNVNTINLWKSYGHNLCKEFLDNSRVVKDGWLNKDWINKYIDVPELDVSYVNKFLGILAFEIWYRLFVTKELDSNTKLD